MSRSIVLVLALIACGEAWAADVPPPCQPGPIAIQIDQVFEKRVSVAFARRESIPFARQPGVPFGHQPRELRSATITQRTHGETQLIVPMTQEGRSLRGAGVMTMDADDHIRARSKSCINKRIFVVNWALRGVVSDQCTIDLTVVREWVEQPTKRTCDLNVFGQFGGVYPPISETWQASLKTGHGASTKRETGNFSGKDISTLTVVRAAQAP